MGLKEIEKFPDLIFIKINTMKVLHCYGIRFSIFELMKAPHNAFYSIQLRQVSKFN